VPTIRRIAVLSNPANPSHAEVARYLDASAGSLGVEIRQYRAREPADFEGLFAAMAKDRAEALLVIADSSFGLHRRVLIALAARQRLPAMYGLREFPEAGGLMSYNVDARDSFRRAAVYVDRILKGARPADLPVEQPSRFELVINRATARALGIAMPQSLLLRGELFELRLLRRRALGARLRGGVDLRERLEVEVRVHLRARDRRVAEHLLHGAQVARRLQHVRGERVAQHVRMHVARKTLADRPLAEPLLDRARRQAPAVAADEQRILVLRHVRASHRQPSLDRRARGRADRHDPLLAALADDAYLAGGEVAAGDVELRELGQSQPGRRRELAERAIATRQRVVRVDRDQARGLLG
jgi:putative ABC transport system substrate-binding protein